MRKLLLVLMVASLLVVGLAAPAMSGYAPGFLLAGANGAYANFDDGVCVVEVGYVWAKVLKLFGTNETIHPHSDLEVKLSGASCPLAGEVWVEPTADNPDAVFETLESASVTAIDIRDGGEDVLATVSIDWEATGDTERFFFKTPAERQSGKWRAANVTNATVEIAGYGTTFTLSHLQPDPFITHYTEMGRVFRF